MDNILLPDGANEDRTARISALAWHPKDGEVRNLFTHIRHRRADRMGPWANEPDEVWRTTAFPFNEIAEPGEIKLYIVDAPLTYCLERVGTSWTEKRWLSRALRSSTLWNSRLDAIGRTGTS